MRPSAIVCLVAAAMGCTGGSAGESVPPAEVYTDPVTFVGEWLGEVEGVMGTLQIVELEPLRYRGLFRAENDPLQYVLSMERLQAGGAAESVQPTNQVTFTWQDGHGSRGAGWLVINREDTALTGESGYDEAPSGAGSWTFIRVE